MTETRYRRLLALYPRDFRQEYGEEMLAVLMTDPRRGQVVDVLRGAGAAHLRAVRSGHDRAARVVQIFGAILLLGVALRRSGGGLLNPLLSAEPRPIYLEGVDAIRLLGWGLVVVAAFRGWRAIGAAAALAALAGEIASPARFYVDTPASVLHVYWMIVAGGVVLIAGLVARGGAVARPRGLAAIVLAGVFLALQSPILFVHELSPLRSGLVALAAALVLVALIRQSSEIRGRLVCWAAPVIVTLPLVQWGFGGFIEHNMRHPESTRLINPMQWTVLVLVPIVAFVATSWLGSRRSKGRPVAADGFGGTYDGDVRRHD
ncbi:hypothetical protein [Actinoplanes solisilvae]|uniref:hypothetical protein n=1 Tax=Actinoplanes solisilvae TaxID=2486853 RepID=UPI000FD8B94A|nr:hypothetical protein [Actinoplanes solisilvae]